MPSDRGNGFEGGAASGAHCILLVHINGVLSEILLRVEYFRAYVARVFAFFIPHFYHYVLRVVQVSGKLHQLTFQNNHSELRAAQDCIIIFNINKVKFVRVLSTGILRDNKHKIIMV